MEKLLLILPLVCLLYANEGNFTEKATHQAVTLPKGKDPAKLIIGKWQVTAIEGEKENLESLVESERMVGEKVIEISQQLLFTFGYEFTEKGTYKQFTGNKIDRKGKYELRAAGKELIFKGKGRHNNPIELIKLTASEMVMRQVIPIGENGHKLVVISKLEK